MRDIERIRTMVKLQELFRRQRNIHLLYKDEEMKLEKFQRDNNVLIGNREDVDSATKEMDKKINEELGTRDEINKRITSLEEGKDKIKIARQLKSWEKEMERMQQELSLVQAQIDYDTSKQLELKGEIERLDERIEENNNKILELKNHIDSVKEENKGELEEIDNETSDLKSTLEDSQFIDYFMSMLSKTDGNAIVEVEEDSCSGCNVVLPTYLQGELGPDLTEDQVELYQCPHCFRYLYYPEWTEVAVSEV